MMVERVSPTNLMTADEERSWGLGYMMGRNDAYEGMANRPPLHFSPAFGAGWRAGHRDGSR